MRTSVWKSKKNCAWDAHIAKVVGKGKAHESGMDAIRTDSHLDTRTKKDFLMNAIIPKARICRKSMGKGLETFKTAGNGTDDSSQKKYWDAQVRRVI